MCACLLLRWRRKAARRREENRRTHPPTAATMYNLIVTCKNVSAMYRVSQKQNSKEDVGRLDFWTTLAHTGYLGPL